MWGMRLGVLLVVLLACCSCAAPKPKTFVISGEVSMVDFNVKPDQPCFAKSGYDDIKAGAQITVSDDKSVKVALGTLEAGRQGKPAEGETDPLAAVAAKFVCVFPFHVDGVPEGSQIYSLSVGNAVRGDVDYKRADLNKPITLSLG